MSDINERIAALNLRLLEVGITGSELADQGNGTFRLEVHVPNKESRNVLKVLSE